MIDECDEDFIPPTITFKEGLNVDAYEEDNGLTIINSPAFASLEAARKFLAAIVKAEDDCAAILNVLVTSPSAAACENSIFTVTATDPRCSSTNPLQTKVRQFAIKVDEERPTANITFERERDAVYFDSE